MGNSAILLLHGFHLFDKVLYQNEECFVTGKRTSGSFRVGRVDGAVIKEGVGYKKLKLLETAKHYITERRSTVSAPYLKAGSSTA